MEDLLRKRFKAIMWQLALFDKRPLEYIDCEDIPVLVDQFMLCIEDFKQEHKKQILREIDNNKD